MYVTSHGCLVYTYVTYTNIERESYTTQRCVCQIYIYIFFILDCVVYVTYVYNNICDMCMSHMCIIMDMSNV